MSQKEFNLFKHPLMVLAELSTEDKSENISLQLFTYARPGDGNHDAYTAVPPANLHSTALRMWKSLAPNHELGITSQVEVDADIASGIMHIPQIDFAENCVQPAASYICDVMEEAFPNLKLSLFTTGRSLHAYGDRLLYKEEWYRWLGKLLRADHKDALLPNVDYRWIGFSLERGYSALRLSANSEMSLAVPTFVERFPKGTWGLVTETKPEYKGERDMIAIPAPPPRSSNGY